MFLDASAVVAILVKEPDSDVLVEKLERAEIRLTSPLARYETVLAIHRLLAPPNIEITQSAVDRFFALYDVQTVDITSAIGDHAVLAFERYGKGRHEAQLNMSDCFSYACAKELKVPLLFKGSDFSKTDIKPA